VTEVFREIPSAMKLVEEGGVGVYLAQTTQSPNEWGRLSKIASLTLLRVSYFMFCWAASACTNGDGFAVVDTGPCKYLLQSEGWTQLPEY